MTTETVKPEDYKDSFGEWHFICCCCWKETGDLRRWSCGCYGEKAHWKDGQVCREHKAVPHDD